jgi:sulfhydrogenase subunit beta (sulfur reductase)
MPVPTHAPPARLGVNDHAWIAKPTLGRLIADLAGRGYRVVGPQVADGAIVYRDLASTDALPAGWIDEQDGGSYRLRRDDTAGWFDHVVGPHSLKNFLFPPREGIQFLVRQAEGWQEEEMTVSAQPLAVIGPRGCDLAALRIQDRVFLEGPHVDPAYAARRQKLFIIAVNCRRAAATCFCHSMECGPAVTHGHDLALTEWEDRFAVEVGSTAGADVIASLAAADLLAACSAADAERVRGVPRQLAQAMHGRTAATPPINAKTLTAGANGSSEPKPRSLDTTGIRDLLFDNLHHPRWQDVAERCLACGNCTLVCPTCFCSSVHEVADLDGDHAVRERRWASCFSLDHAQMHGTNARPTVASRYRQWLTHKLAGWIDQFGTSGCTGCGRCITWCPVGIDLTAEVAAIRETHP